MLSENALKTAHGTTADFKMSSKSFEAGLEAKAGTARTMRWYTYSAVLFSFEENERLSGKQKLVL